MKRTDPELISTLIDRVMLSGENRTVVLEQRACSLWPEVVGPGVNKYTYRRYVDHGVLHVYLSSAALKNELSFHRSKLVEEINKLVGEPIVTEVQIH